MNLKINELLENSNLKMNTYLNEGMDKHTSFKTGGKADVFIKIDNVNDLKYILDFSNKNNIPLYIIGNGSNTLVTDKGIRGIVCQININKFEIQEKEKDIFVTVGAGNKIIAVANKLKELDIGGFEFASRNSRNSWWSN